VRHAPRLEDQVAGTGDADQIPDLNPDLALQHVGVLVLALVGFLFPPWPSSFGSSNLGLYLCCGRDGLLSRVVRRWYINYMRARDHKVQKSDSRL
jgi:hypothetical protein